jgi:RNA polymerase sigma-70 factor, ECF subfamily
MTTQDQLNRDIIDQVRAIREGQADAFEQLFRTWCQPLISFARRFVRDTQTAESIVQDVFFAVWTHRSRLDPHSNIKAYLYTATRNTALKHLRHHAVIRHDEEAILEEIPDTHTPDTALQAQELAAAVHEAIEELPDSRKHIFKLSRFDQLTYAEIAKVENISIKTVETQMGRALKYLRQRLVHLRALMILLLHHLFFHTPLSG